MPIMQKPHEKEIAGESQTSEAPQAAVQPKPYVDASLMQDSDAGKQEQELVDTKDKLLRAMAELENQRRRTERDLKDASSYAVAKFAGDMLGIADNLRRALESATPETKADKLAAAVLEGVEITERALLQTLERYGVKPIAALGAKFDPNLHQAMYEAESAETAPGTVVHEVQKGYTIHDRTLRPSMVGVAKAKAASSTD